MCMCVVYALVTDMPEKLNQGRDSFKTRMHLVIPAGPPLLVFVVTCVQRSVTHRCINIRCLNEVRVLIN